MARLNPVAKRALAVAGQSACESPRAVGLAVSAVGRHYVKPCDIILSERLLSAVYRISASLSRMRARAARTTVTQCMKSEQPVFFP